MTMILVTHDQEEAMAVSDRIFVMNNGKDCPKWYANGNLYETK